MSNINHQDLLEQIPIFCKKYKKKINFEIYRTSEIIYTWVMNFYEIESTIEEIYGVVSFQIKKKMNDFHLFVCNKSLALDYLTFDGDSSPFDFDISQNDSFNASASTFRWQFDSLSDKDVGIIDKTKTLFYERVSNQLYCNVSMQDDSDILISIVFPSDLNESSRKIFFPRNDDVLAWSLPNEIKATNPINPLFKNFLNVSAPLKDNYIINLYIEKLHWKWSNEVENRYFDLYKLKEIFVLTKDVPFIQFINFSGKQNIDLQSSSISILTNYISVDNFEILQKWENQTRQKIKNYYHPKNTILIYGFYKKKQFALIIYGNGEIFVEFEFSNQNQEKHVTFMDFFNNINIDNEDNEEENAFTHILKQIMNWDDNLILFPIEKRISFISNYFNIQKKFTMSFYNWVLTLNPFVRLVQEKEKYDLQKVLVSLKYKRVSNYQKNVFDALTSYYYNMKLQYMDEKDAYDLMSDFLKNAFDKNEEEITKILNEWKKKTKQNKYIRYTDGIDIYVSAYNRVYINGIASMEYFIHSLFFVNEMLACYFNNVWKSISVSKKSPNLELVEKSDLKRVRLQVTTDTEKVDDDMIQSDLILRQILTQARSEPDETREDEPQVETANRNDGSPVPLSNLLDFDLNEEEVEGGAKRGRPPSGTRELDQSKKKSRANVVRPRVNSSNSSENEDEELRNSSMKSHRGFRISELKKYDPEVFDFPSKKKYSRFCQTRHGRVPIVIPDKENFEEMARKIRERRQDETTEEYKKRMQETLRGDTRLFHIPNKKIVDGYALKYRDRFYICPEAYCLDCKLPLLLKDLNLHVKIPNTNVVMGYEEFMSSEYFKKGHKSSQPVEIISGSCPICGKKVIAREENKVDPSSRVLITSNVLGRQGYPGYISQSSHPSKLNMVCCFNKPFSKVNPNLKENVSGFNVFSEYKERDSAKPATKPKKKKRYNNESSNTSNTSNESNKANEQTPYEKSNQEDEINSNSPRQARERIIEPRTLYIMMEKKFVHVNKYGLLPGVLDDIFNQGRLQTYKSITGVPFDKKNMSYMQFLRKGLPWSKGMFSNLMDIVYSLLFPEADPFESDKKYKINKIIGVLKDFPDFKNYFELVSDGYIANFFSQRNKENPHEAFFIYLENSPIWHDFLVLPVLSIPGLIPLNDFYFPLFVLITYDSENNFNIKLSLTNFSVQHVIFFLIKKRVSDEISSNPNQWWVSGGYNYELIVFMVKEKDEFLKEVRYFLTSSKNKNLLGNEDQPQQVIETMQNIVFRFTDWIKSSYDKIDKESNMSEYFIPLNEIYKLISNNKEIHVAGQLIDIMFRCTNLLLVYRKYAIWFPIYPRKIIMNKGERKIRPYFFSNEQDLNFIARFTFDVSKTLKTLEVFEKLFQDQNIDWISKNSYRDYKLIFRIMQSFSVKETIQEDSFVTGIRLNKYAFVRTNRTPLNLLVNTNVPLEREFSDNYTFDYQVSKNLTFEDEAHLDNKMFMKKNNEWNILLYMFNKYMKSKLPMQTRKRFIQDVSEQDFSNYFKEFSTTLYWSNTPVENKFKIYKGKYILSEENISLLKKLYVEFLSNVYLRYTLLSEFYPWTKPTLKTQKNKLTFVYAEWKNKVIDYISNLYLKN
jgi:hypothetical protein